MKRRHAAEGEALNLIPIMNLVTPLIPFLLMSAQFVSYAIIESRLPAICAEPDCGAAEPDAVSVRLVVRSDGFHLVATGSSLPDLEAGVSVPCPADDCVQALPALREHLTRLKDAHPELADIVLVPDADVAYESVVLAMDGTREDPGAAAYPGEACEGRCLFPRVTVAGGTEAGGG